VLTIIPHLVKDKSGVAAIEYGLLAALIGVAAISVMDSWHQSQQHVQHGRQ
jgi:Flp pilus assembly pilin Flp